MNKVLRLNVGGTFEEIPVKGMTIEYEELHKAVGGYIEHVEFNRTLAELGIDVWCVEEGKIKGLEPSSYVVDFTGPSPRPIEVLAGPLVFTGRGADDNSYPLTDEQIEKIMAVFVRTPYLMILPFERR